jgi:beta-exotoxin I transport system permease protein
MKRIKMNKNLFFNELKANLRSFWIWSGVLFFLALINMSSYRTMAKSSKELEALMNKMPQGLKAVFHMDKLSMGNILGYYSTKSLAMVMMLGSMFCVILLSSIISKEEADKTAEYLMAKPLSRNEIAITKILSGLTLIFIFFLIVFVSNFAFIEMFKLRTYNFSAFLMINLGILIIYFLFASIGLFISMFISSSRALISVSIGIVMAAFFLNTIARLTQWLEFLKYISPFYYLDPGDIILGLKSPLPGYAGMFVASIILIVVSVLLYRRKDILI